MSEHVIRPGKYVSLTYSITDARGTLLEQTDLPVGYIHGGNTELIGGMDEAIAGKCAGDSIELALGPDQAFGPRDPNLTFSDDIENVPPEYRQLGAEVQMQSDTGDVRTFYVTAIDGGRITIDGNHPLAGKALEVHVYIQEVRDPTREELVQDGEGAAIPGATLH